MFITNWKAELFGIVGSILVFISMLYKTDTYKGAFWLRLTNSIGSVVYIVYGFLLPAPSTVILNTFTAVINIYHIFRLKKDYGVNDNETK